MCNREVEIWKVFSPSATRKRFQCLIASFYWFLLQIFLIRFTFTDYLLGLVLVTVQFLLQFKVNFSKNLESGLGTLEQKHKMQWQAYGIIYVHTCLCSLCIIKRTVLKFPVKTKSSFYSSLAGNKHILEQSRSTAIPM